MNKKLLLSKTGSAVKGVVHRKAYHLTHDWTAIACIVVTFLDCHGPGQIVLGIGLVFAVLDYLIGEEIKFGA